MSEEDNSFVITDIQKSTPVEGWSNYQSRAFLIGKMHPLRPFTDSFLRVGCTGRVLQHLVYGRTDNVYIDDSKYISFHGITAFNRNSPSEGRIFNELWSNLKIKLHSTGNNWLNDMNKFSEYHLGNELNQNNFYDNGVRIWLFFFVYLFLTVDKLTTVDSLHSPSLEHGGG